jgi:hypothetical protein
MRRGRDVDAFTGLAEDSFGFGMIMVAFTAIDYPGQLSNHGVALLNPVIGGWQHPAKGCCGEIRASSGFAATTNARCTVKRRATEAGSE